MYLSVKFSLTICIQQRSNAEDSILMRLPESHVQGIGFQYYYA